MKYISTLFLLFTIIVEPYCQTLYKKIVCDGKTHKGIPFATIKVLNKPLGIYTNELGWFNLPLHDNDSLQVSSIGYYNNILKAKDDTIFLTQRIITIDEITVSPRKYETFCFGNANLKSERYPIPFLSDGKKANFTEMACLIEIPENITHYKINGILMMVENPKGKPLARLHIYKPGLDGLPGEEILPEDIIINHCIKHNKIDLSRFDLFTNERKLFVGFEFVVTDFQEFKNVSKNRIRFCFTNSQMSNYTYIRTILSQKYTWRPIFTRVNNDNHIPDNLMVSLIIE